MMFIPSDVFLISATHWEGAPNVLAISARAVSVSSIENALKPALS